MEIIRYTIGGVSSSVAEYLSYLLSLKYFRLSPYISTIIGFITSTIVSFLFNEFFVYQHKHHIKDMFFSFIKNFMTYFGTGIILKEVLMYLFIEHLHFSDVYAPIIILLIIAPLNYLITKFWAFSRQD